MSDIDDYIKKNTKFLKIGDGEIFRGSFIKYVIIPDEFNPGEETVMYYFHDLDGNELAFKSSSIKLAQDLAKKAKTGQKIAIKRSGEARNTRYEVGLGDAGEMPSEAPKSEDEDIMF